MLNPNDKKRKTQMTYLSVIIDKYPLITNMGGPFGILWMLTVLILGTQRPK